MTIDAQTLEELQEAAGRFAAELGAKERGATLITLSGDLGAGKTSFTQGIARAFGVTEHVTSPTFVLEKIYQLPEPVRGFTHLVHIDAYRLKNGEELNALGFSQLMQEPANLVLMEWPERVDGALPAADKTLSFAVKGAGRTISYA
ncbi:MAG TPA: tRNA (adenosine(37)-N6)-threonylcarbamoyltransferase complex ATPase subunit type 1 TsaE [Candidatus Paceibacterota bacterium]|nr:tRNA (adenosine(37)-N6)-threonylcarbamoyltransferase complex ATPase subunit type 1 TsaE [Candidatus Paceibacterota bacterium]